MKALSYQVFEDRQNNVLNIADLRVEVAISIVGSFLEKANLELNKVFPDFEQNFEMLSRTIQQESLDIRRIDMPVIKSGQVNQFRKALANGKLDVFPPFTKGKMKTVDYNDPQHKKDRFLRLGKKDGDLEDDIVKTSIRPVTVKDLNPIQSQIWLEIVMDMGKNTYKTGLDKIKSKSVIVSNDGYLIDGHHRWAFLMLKDPNLQIKALNVPLTIEKLLDVARSYGAAIGNTPNQ